MTWDLGNSLNWEPVGTLGRGTTYTAGIIPGMDFDKYWLPIPVKTYTPNSRVLKVGVRNQYAKPNWSLGVFLAQHLQVKPDSGTLFGPNTQTKRYGTKLGMLTLIEFPEYDSYPYLLRVEIPKWHKEIYLEVWEYVP